MVFMAHISSLVIVDAISVFRIYISLPVLGNYSTISDYDKASGYTIMRVICLTKPRFASSHL